MMGVGLYATFGESELGLVTELFDSLAGWSVLRTTFVQ